MECCHRQKMSNSFIAGYTKNDESRGDPGKLFPFVDILAAWNSLHVVRVRTVHAEQRAALQHLPAPGQLHALQQPPLADVRRHRCSATTPRTSSSPLSRAHTSTTRWPTSTRTRTASSPTRTGQSLAVTLRRFQVRYSKHPRPWTSRYQPLDGLERRRLRARRMAAAEECHCYRGRAARHRGLRQHRLRRTRPSTR